MSENIIVESRGRVGVIRLNRPQALNALNSAVIEGDIEAANEAIDAIGGADEATAAELRRMVREYRFDEVQDLLEGLGR